MSALQSFLLTPSVAILAIGALVGVAASLLGAFLVLRRESMLSDAISHSVLLGIVGAYLLTGALAGFWSITGAALAGLLSVLLTEALLRTRRVKRDAAIGLVFPALFALAVLLINLFARDVHLDADAVLLGEIAFAWLDTVALFGLEVPRSLAVMALIAAVNLAFVALLFKELKLASFDPALAQALGYRPRLLGLLLWGLLAVTAVGAFEAVGVVLFVAFVVVPAATAVLLTDRLPSMIAIAVAVAIASSFLGYGVALRLDASIGGAMASATGVFLLLALLLGPRHGLLARWRRRAAPVAPAEAAR